MNPLTIIVDANFFLQRQNEFYLRMIFFKQFIFFSLQHAIKIT